MEVMVAVGEGMENGDVRGIKMVTKEVDEEMDNSYEDMMDEVLEESMGEGVDDMDKEAAPDLGDGRPSVIYFNKRRKKQCCHCYHECSMPSALMTHKM